jgi:hypothetical protein
VGTLHTRRRLLGIACATAVSAFALTASAGVAVPVDTGGDGPPAADASVWFDPRHQDGGDIPRNFVGLSIEWSLIERYMGSNARPAFGNLLANLDSGVLRIGGSSQDLMPFDPDAPNTNQVITPTDLADIRATLDRTNEDDGRGSRPSWGVVLGTAMAPPRDTRPFVSPEHAHRFVTEGVAPAFSADASRDVAGIELGNEPDLSYGSSNVAAYLDDLRAYSAPEVTGPFPIVWPNTSEDILPWQDIHNRAVPTRWFWNWPEILQSIAGEARERAGNFRAYASDHFYPLARTCVNRPYRCPSISALLSDEHLASLQYQVYVHARQAARAGLGYRLEETNTAAGRGADGVSNVAASATYALDVLFNVACPQPPHLPGANSECATGGIGVNFHNAEVRAFFAPEEGNAYYNAVDYDPSPAMGAPTAAPVYYAMLLFAHFAQGATDLRPVTVSMLDGSQAAPVKAWRVEDGATERRLFLLNKADHPVTVEVGTPAETALIDRMTPYDPTGAGRMLDAPEVVIDGQQVAADGVWPGFAPTTQPVRAGQLSVRLAAGEAAVITVH